MDNYKNPKPNKTYISPSLNAFGGSGRRIRIISKVIESPDSYAFAKMKDEIVLRHKKNARTEIKAKIFEDNRNILVLSIQGYTEATEKPHNASFSFVGNEIIKLIDFILNTQSVNLKNNAGMNITDDELSRIKFSSNQIRQLLHENQEIFTEVLKSEVTKEDIVAVGYRKKQLEVYNKLLNDEEYFHELLAKKKCKVEGLWQKYFEKNTWVFGYGLGYIFLSNLDKKKLEQVVQGYSLFSHGKRVDALMKTRGIISNLCFVEIKTHETKLLSSQPYRSGCWAPSKELSGAISQIQGTVASTLDRFTSKINIEDKNGDPTGEEIFNYQPKSYLVIGSLEEFMTENGINRNKYRSFELFRKNIVNPEIITFDELYERAKFIVYHNER